MRLYDPSEGSSSPEHEIVILEREPVFVEAEMAVSTNADATKETDWTSPTSEQDWYWAPLLDAVGAEVAEQFDWRAETGTIQTYEHRETFRYVHIDSVSRNFFDQQCNVITREAALLHALPPKPTAPVKAIAEDMTPVLPGLDAFTRKPMQEATGTLVRAHGDDGAGAEMEHVPRGIMRWFSAAKRKMGSGRNGAQESFTGRSVLVEEQATEHHEPSLATFTRKKFEYER